MAGWRVDGAFDPQNRHRQASRDSSNGAEPYVGGKYRDTAADEDGKSKQKRDVPAIALAHSGPRIAHHGVNAEESDIGQPLSQLSKKRRLAEPYDGTRIGLRGSHLRGAADEGQGCSDRRLFPRTSSSPSTLMPNALSTACG